MMDDRHVDGPPVPRRAKITLSMDELNASLDSFQVEPTRGRVVAAADTLDIDCTDGATCNFKCGPTAYWECGPTTPYDTCGTTLDASCFSCAYPYCVTEYVPNDPFC